MGFSVIPTNIGGASINSLAGPLAALLNPTPTLQNLTYPSDLGSNPAMGHAVIIQAYDRTTGLQQSGSAAVQSLGAAGNNLINATKDLFNGNFSGSVSDLGNAASNLTSAAGSSVNLLTGLAQAGQYQAQKQGSPLVSIALFMPEAVNVEYNSSYNEVSMTDQLGLVGMFGNAYSDATNAKLKDAISPYASAAASKVINDLGSLIGTGSSLGDMVGQSLFNQITNPQMQLLYRGIGLRTFQLEFVMTPKSSAEAQTVKNICDAFTFYSLPGLAGAQVGNSGQFLTPPQLFSVDFKFLGQNSVIGNASQVISSALTNSGLGFLTSSTNFTDAAPAKTFTVGDCVLENVSVDYTPNGWATYNDGYPVQTRLSLQFKETEMLTKEYFKKQNQNVYQGYYGAGGPPNGPVNLGDVTGNDQLHVTGNDW